MVHYCVFVVFQCRLKVADETCAWQDVICVLGIAKTPIYLMACFSGQCGYASIRKVKPIWILMKQEIIVWQWHQLDHMQIICTLLQTDEHQHLMTYFFTCQMFFLMHNQQCQSTEGIKYSKEFGKVCENVIMQGVAAPRCLLS